MNFEFYNPTRLIFGVGKLSQLGEAVSKYGKKALLVTGGGSVKRNGTFERAIASLASAGIAVTECSGVEPNPRIETVRRGAQIARNEGCDVIIALGGGSTMDASKIMAAAFYYDGDPWDLVFHGQPDPYIPTRALPIITVPTLAATGSEMNMGAAILNEETNEKSVAKTECLFPKIALVDPELTVSVPKNHTAYGVCDLMTHVTERYFNGVDGTPIQDRFAEGVILTVMEWGPKAVADGNDVEARAQLQWAAIVALNGFVNVGTHAGRPVHAIELILSGYHDTTHGASIATINPSWMRFAARRRPQKFVQFAERVFGLKAKGCDDIDCALQGIDRFEAFLKGIGCPTRLSELHIDEALFPRYAQDILRVFHDANGNLPARPAMSAADIIEVLQTAW